MSHGKTGNNSEKNDDLVEKLNRFFARLMGKKTVNQAPKPNSTIPSNRSFILIVAAMVFLLWGLTGVYYIPDGNYGLIFRNGKITHEVKGISLGVTLPYPLSDVETLDATTNNLSIGKESANLFQLSTKDNYTLQLSGEVAYSISDPQKYYLNYYQETSDLNQKVAWLVMANIQKYFLQHTRSELLNSSSIVLANEIRQQIEQQVQNYGLELSKFSILNLQNIVNSSINNSNESDINGALEIAPLNTKILQQAYAYQQFNQAETESVAVEFKSLLPQYQANKSAIVELVYYKMLSNIPSQASESYPLLNLTQDQFINLVQNPRSNINSIKSVGGRNDIRAVSRSVKRQRDEGRFNDVAQ